MDVMLNNDKDQVRRPSSFQNLLISSNVSSVSKPLYDLTISALDLEALIRDDSVVVVDCRCSLTDADYGRRSFAAGHLPGARFANLEEDLSQHGDPARGRHPLPDFKRFLGFLGSLGISKTSQVVVYDDVSGAVAGRLWWMLSRWLNHQAVAVLDGGFKQWQAAGFPLSTEEPDAEVAVYEGSANDDAWISTAALVDLLATNAVTVIDARSSERYTGKEEPIDPVAGHIPGSANLFLGGNLKAGLYADDQTLAQRFAGVVEKAGGPENIVHSCGSGVSAVHNLIAMEKGGFSGSRLYVGSWSEWIRDPNRPVARA